MKRFFGLITALGAVSAGTVLVRSQFRSRGTKPASLAANTDVNKNKTTKQGRSTRDVPLESASPIGQDEIQANMASEAMGDGAATEPVPTSPRKRQQRKKTEPPQPLNPRRQKNSRPS
jgi:hypothetical protein